MLRRCGIGGGDGDGYEVMVERGANGCTACKSLSDGVRFLFDLIRHHCECVSYRFSVHRGC